MADTPPNNTEQRLRNYAQQRRNAAGTPGMHPATRRLLQAEVRQRLGASASSAQKLHWLKLFWPRITATCGLFIVLGMTVLLMQSPGTKSKETASFARLAESDRTESAKMRSRPEAPAARPVATAGDLPVETTLTVNRPGPPAADTLRQRKRMDSLYAAEPAASGAPLAFSAGKAESVPSATAPGSDSYFDGRAKTSGEARSSEASSLADTATGGGTEVNGGSIAGVENGLAENQKGFFAGGVEPLPSATSASTSQFGTTQLFWNTATLDLSKDKTTNTIPVLGEFTVTQQGEELTVVDRDGSVYNGFARPATIESPIENQSAGTETPQQMASSRAVGTVSGMNQASQRTQIMGYSAAQSQGNLSQVGARNFVFRVEGTNRSLNQRVVFTGNLLQNGTVNSAQNSTLHMGLQNQTRQRFLNNQASVQNTQNPAANNYINGRVQLGDSKTSSELNAFSAGQ